MKVLTLLFFLVNSAFCLAQEAEFTFDNDRHRFPKTAEGKRLQHTYHFRNTGDVPLMITDVDVSCACTTYRFPLQPVMPGARDSITVTFDTKGKIGLHDRTLYIYGNTSNSPAKIGFRVRVVKK